MTIKNTIEAYKAVCVKNKISDDVSIGTAKYGFMLDATVEMEEIMDLVQYYTREKIDASGLDKVLFTVEEMKNDDLLDKVIKQIVHYISGGNYGKNTVELEGKTATVDVLRVVTVDELQELVQADLYGGVALDLKRVANIMEMITEYGLQVDSKQIQNNEIKVHLFDKGLLDEMSGDDLVRWVVFKATNNTMLIKSRDVINMVKDYSDKDTLVAGLYAHKDKVAAVFNRHKRIILALKDLKTRTRINEISKLSKTGHVPLRESISDRFISHFLKMEGYNDTDLEKLIRQVLATDKITIRDMLKYINLLRVRKQEIETKVFLVRNGKAFFKPNEEKWTKRHELIFNTVFDVLCSDLEYLKDKKIKYPINVDYGLPVSEKQSLGHLPFGTKIYTEGFVSAGMYWENNGGAHDLDLSAIRLDGQRTGWGNARSLHGENELLFSGDITNAPKGAIEYMTQNKDEISPVVLINNIYSGNEKSKYKLIVGETTLTQSGRHLDKPTVEIDTSFIKRSESLGVMKSNEFVVYKAALSNRSISNDRDRAILPYINSDFMTMRYLLDTVGVELNPELAEGETYDVDLSVESITFDKLVKVFER